MSDVKGTNVSRRDFLRLAAATATAAAATGPFFHFSGRAGAQTPPARAMGTLKIAKWAHFLPDYDAWFAGVLARQWGERHGVQVVVDHIPVEEIGARAASEAAAGKGHDLFMFPWPPAEYQAHAIDHTEIYQSVSFRWGSVDRIGHRSTFDPKTKRYFAFADSWMPTPLHFREDQWRTVSMPLGPVHYGSLRSGGHRLREKAGVPCGLALTPTLEGNITLYSLLQSFGGGVLDAAGNLVLDQGARTIAALEYVKALHAETGAPELLGWGPGDNVRALGAGRTSCTVNAISALRTAEKDGREISRQIRLSPPLLGFAGVMAAPHVTNCSVVWKFADNVAGATQFLGDMIDSSRSIYEQTGGCNFPSHPKTLPDLIVRLENDGQGDPPYKYKELKDALHWTTNLGFPGFATPAAMAAFNSFVVPRMFLRVAKGELGAQEAVRAAAVEVRSIVDRWKQT
jgi:multiple sugar transport system substrate-binding protein